VVPLDVRLLEQPPLMRLLDAEVKVATALVQKALLLRLGLSLILKYRGQHIFVLTLGAFLPLRTHW
jgi:hypothetical protein